MSADERRQDTPQNAPQDETGQVAHIVGRIHGLKFMVEQTLRNSSSDEVSQCAKAACDSLDDAAGYLDDVLERLVAQRSRNLMDLLNQEHEGK